MTSYRAFRAGHAALRRGENIDANPYRFVPRAGHSSRRQSWRNGWRAALAKKIDMYSDPYRDGLAKGRDE